MKQWPTLPLGTLCEVNIGRTPSRDVPAYWAGTHPWASIRDLADGDISETREQISDEALTKMPPPAPAGTLLASFKLTIGRVAVSLRAMHHNEAIASLPINDHNQLDRDFLRHVLPRVMLATTANDAVLGKVLNKATLQGLPIPLPPLEEQRRIVGLLDRAAEIRRRADAARAKARAIVPALFLDMFGDPATNPKGWSVVRVADAGEVKLGRQRAPKYHTGKFTRPYVRVANVFENLIDVSDLLSMDFDAQDFATYSLAHGDILLNEGQSIELVGRPAMWRDEVRDCCFQNTLVRFRCDPTRTVPEFALAAFLWMYRSGRFTQTASKTSNVAHLGAGRFAKLPMILPPLPLQTTFADQAQRLEATVRTLDAAGAKADSVVAALSAKVFSAPPKGKHNGVDGVSAPC